MQPQPEEPALPEPRRLALAFTGSGNEYFRIWIVNLLLTVATLGIYSAWAKVRRLQYFYRNTQLAGACFDFTGDPKSILKGRLIAVALLLGYQYAFGFSLAVGAGFAAALILWLPFLMHSALRFRLSNTAYRGLPFGFGGSVRGAYLAYLPPALTVLLPGALLAMDPRSRLAAAVMLLYLGWPLMHGRMKRYQHANILYGDQQARYGVRPWKFYGPYLMCALWIVLGVVITLVISTAARLGVTHLSKAAMMSGAGNWVLTVISGALGGYVVFLAAAPYMHVRINNLVWSSTSFAGVRIESSMKAWGMLRLQAVNVLLTLLTLGLYRPFAVVNVYRYRAEHLSVQVQGEFDEVLGGAAPRQAGAAGDGAADFIGVDISW
ncbi:YjgN family protein [Massilia solisilvae]|uniref:YjgN family protein n=1 Tax=Massilia solisilvae TaxID=1811225 RepID=A0ABT2BF34_9BURK|nr:YjgN family protein [Massilia solisilvae]MCS0607120.1 YjgN family protein [Massilia solisilvae]